MEGISTARQSSKNPKKLLNHRVVPPVAPHESCIVCFKGDVTTAIGFEGEAEFIMGALYAMGVPFDQAKAIVEAFTAAECGCALGQVPSSDISMDFRICRSCGQKIGLEASPLPEIRVYRQGSWRRGE